MSYEYREVKPPQNYRAPQLIDEAERQAYILQSAKTRDGKKPDYNDIRNSESQRWR